MSRRVLNSLVFLFCLYVFFEWGKIAFISLLVAGIGPYIYLMYYNKSGHWPWISTAPVTLGGQNSPSISESKPKITFADVAGIDEAKEDLLEIVDFLKNKDKYLAVGARLPKGVLMIGQPGVGKTLSAKAIAGEAGVSMIEMAGSSFVEKYVGVGASNIRALFQRAEKKRHV